MSEQYRLVYSAEVIEGQHAAVVRKRLAAVLKLDDERMDVLFSGKPVVVKKSTDSTTAARYQEAFKKAGARLRVLPVEGEAASAASAARTQAAPAPGAGGDDQPASQGGLNVLPAGADVLTDAERPEAVEAEVDTSHLAVQGAVFATDEPRLEAEGPNVDHLTLAELGARLGVGTPEDVVVAEIDVDFDLAEVGAVLGALDAPTPAPVVDIEAVDFELAEPGADMDTSAKKAAPAPPDTSHLKLDDS